MYSCVWTFPYRVQNQPCEMAMTAIRGHLFQYDFTEAHKKWNSCDPVELFAAPLVTSIGEGMEGLETMLKDEAKKATLLILWLDCESSVGCGGGAARFRNGKEQN